MLAWIWLHWADSNVTLYVPMGRDLSRNNKCLISVIQFFLTLKTLSYNYLKKNQSTNSWPLSLIAKYWKRNLHRSQHLLRHTIIRKT